MTSLPAQDINVHGKTSPHPVSWRGLPRNLGSKKGSILLTWGMRGEMERRAIYGSEVFVDKFKKAYELEEMIKPIGRPKTEPR